jgi:hypothetical protein
MSVKVPLPCLPQVNEGRHPMETIPYKKVLKFTWSCLDNRFFDDYLLVSKVAYLFNQFALFFEPQT